jgi:hypothetical protein
MIRSGSTWSFNVALNLIRSADPAHQVFGFYDENPVVLKAALKRRSSHLVIKSHALHPSAHEYCRTNAIKAIFTWRSPYDAVVSATRMFGSTVEHWINVIRSELRIWSFHLETNSAYIVPYKAIIRNPSSEIAAIASYLDLSVEPEKVRQIAQELSLERLREFSHHVAELDPRRLVRSNGCIYDRRTLLHANHIRDGGIGYGIKSLCDRDLVAIDSMLCEEGFAYLCEPHRANLAQRADSPQLLCLPHE